MTDTLLSNYYYLDLEIIKILVLISTSCPMYLFVPPPPPPTPRWTSGHLEQWTWNNQKE